jgi:hypothetical protein
MMELEWHMSQDPKKMEKMKQIVPGGESSQSNSLTPGFTPPACATTVEFAGLNISAAQTEGFSAGK